MPKFKLLGIVVGGLVLGALLALAGCAEAEQKPTTTTVPAGTEREVKAEITVSKPGNGTHFVAGEQATLTIALQDQAGNAFDRANDFSQLRLMLAGPQKVTETVTAVKLLKASADRTQPVHHYIDLKTNADVQVSGNKLTYKLAAVSDEKPGTYIASLWVVSKAAPLQQAMVVAEFQLGTATVEKQVVEKEKCATCHLGADSGKFYFAHIDVGFSPVGNPSLDQNAVRNCKTCHNQDGYSAFVDPADGTTRVPDPIVHRVHGVHMGEHLKSIHSVGSEEEGQEGVFGEYLHVLFPKDVRNCTSCHVDDRWKTQPSQLACGTCHDATWFGEVARLPKGLTAHPGGPQANDSSCATCHQPDTKSVAPAISEVHKVAPPAFKNTVELSISSPANGKFFVAGETPKLTITVKDAKTGVTIDPNTIVEPKVSTNVTANEWRRANLFVSGPRVQTKPVLTTGAALTTKTSSYASNDFRVRQDPAKEDPRITRSASAITYQLDDVAGLKAGTYTAFVETMPSVPLGGIGMINFQVGTETPDKTVATNCITCHNDTRMHASYFAVPFNPDICKSCHDYERQIAGKSGWTNSNNGFGAAPLARRVHGVHFGHYTDKPKEIHALEDYSGVIFPQDVRNCTKCHDPAGSSRWKEEPSRVACLACHDKDSAIAHGALMTQDATPVEPYSGDEIETCKTCHGAGRDFSPDKVHNISNPYQPPYPRTPAE